MDEESKKIKYFKCMICRTKITESQYRDFKKRCPHCYERDKKLRKMDRQGLTFCGLVLLFLLLRSLFGVLLMINVFLIHTYITLDEDLVDSGYKLLKIGLLGGIICTLFGLFYTLFLFPQIIYAGIWLEWID